MPELNQILEELETVDTDLAQAGLDDLNAIAAVLEKRNRLIGQATAAIDALRYPTRDQETALRRSRETGITVMRQLILAKHLLSTEIASLKQEQRLWDTVSAQVTNPLRPLLDVKG